MQSMLWPSLVAAIIAAAAVVGVSATSAYQGAVLASGPEAYWKLGSATAVTLNQLSSPIMPDFSAAAPGVDPSKAVHPGSIESYTAGGVENAMQSNAIECDVHCSMIQRRGLCIVTTALGSRLGQLLG